MIHTLDAIFMVIVGLIAMVSSIFTISTFIKVNLRIYHFKIFSIQKQEKLQEILY